MKKFPVWLIIVFVLSLFPYYVFMVRFPDDDLLMSIITAPILILFEALFSGSPLLAAAYLLTVVIRIYFVAKLVYALFHKFNIKISDAAKYVLPSILAVSTIMFFAAMSGIPKHITGF